MRAPRSTTHQRLRDAAIAARQPPARRGGLAAARRAIAQLAPETIEQIARRVAQLLQQPTPQTHNAPQPEPEPVALLNATQLAKRLGVSRSWVYANARRLGAITLGHGPSARLRFDLETARTLLAAQDAKPPPAAPRPAQQRRRPPASGVPLLPVNPRGMRGLLARIKAGRPR